MRPLRAAAEERTSGMTQHLLRRMDDDVRERLHLVLEKRECATRHGASQQPTSDDTIDRNCSHVWEKGKLAPMQKEATAGGQFQP